MNERSYKTALGGILSAAAVSVMFLGGIIPFATYISPILASLCVMIIHTELGAKQSLIVFCAIAILSLLLSPDKEATMIFSVFFGYYPAARHLIEKIRKKSLVFFIKLLLFNLTVIGSYMIVCLILFVPAIASDFKEMSMIMIIVLAAAGNITFLLYDKMISRVMIRYVYRIRPGLIKEKRK